MSDDDFIDDCRAYAAEIEVFDALQRGSSDVDYFMLALAVALALLFVLLVLLVLSLPESSSSSNGGPEVPYT